MSKICKKSGRKPLEISVENIYYTLRLTGSISATADKLHCSRGYIYQELKKVGLNPQDLIKGVN